MPMSAADGDSGGHRKNRQRRRMEAPCTREHVGDSADDHAATRAGDGSDEHGLDASEEDSGCESDSGAEPDANPGERYRRV
jgi:hypothetical protein